MIKSFGSKLAEDLFNGVISKHSRKLHPELHGKALRLLDQINAATKIETLRVPPGNYLEKLSGNYKDFCSIRINKQWRIIFKWIQSDAHYVDIVDYH